MPSAAPPAKYKTKEANENERQILRRLFCVLLCVVIMVCSCVTVSAVPLFEHISTPPYKWIHKSGTTLTINWTGIGLPLGISGLKQDTPAMALNGYWSAGTDNVSAHEVTNYEFLNSMSGGIAFSVPSTEYWNQWNSSFGGAINAFAFPYSIQGEQIYEAVDNVCNKNIDYGFVYFNPSYATSGFSTSTWVRIGAHEVGHILGFGHPTLNEVHVAGHTDSIMRANVDVLTCTSLQSYDIAEFNNLYN